MKFRLKITICMIWLLTLAFGIGGSMLIALNFSNAFEREKATALSSHQMLLSALQIVDEAGADPEHKELASTLEQLNGQEWTGFAMLSLCGPDGEIIYFSGERNINTIVQLAGSATFIGLILTMVCCIVLGMGVPTTANYCIMASTCAPILIKMGFPLVAAHFFVFYFGIVADITPPVALAAYAGSAIAKGNPMKTGINATKLAIAAFIVPYIFAYSPAMLFVNVTSVWEVIQIVLSALLGIFGVAAGLEGFVLRKMNWLYRIVCLVGGLGLMIPGAISDLVGLVLIGGVFVIQYLQNKKEREIA